MAGDYRPRLSIDLTDEQYRKLSNYIPWGLQRPLFSAIVDDLISMMDNGLTESVITAIVSGMLKPSELIQTLKKMNHGEG